MKNPLPGTINFLHPLLMSRRLCFSLSLLAALPGGAGELSFNRDIRPILSENCFYCHGQDGNKRKADMRLDVREAALEKKAFVPGDAAASELVKRILTSDPDEQMPPPDSHRHLSPAQRRMLQDWIAQGAKYETHWAFVAPVRPVVPEVKTPGWARNDVDRFVLARLEAAGLAPSLDADRAVLIRRLHMDLTGLPPSPEEVDAFIADTAPDAYEKLVDRIMASPHYGERMALPWLDAARFADSNGFQQDGDTHQYIWRDWVVKALNADMPFDRFSIEQLAGDLLPDPTEDQLVATAFNRNHLLNGEGGNIAEEQRNVALFDRVDTTATTWLGLTVACSQCHDHKYDPITMRDYYSMFALFNNVPESGVPPGGGQYRIADPWIPVGTDEQRAKLKEMDASLAAAKKAEQNLTKSPEVVAALDAAEKELLTDAPVEWTVLKPGDLTATGGVQLSVLEDSSIYSTGPLPDKADYVISAPAAVPAITGFRIETVPDRRLPVKGAGRSDSGNAVLSRLTVKAGDKDIKLTAGYATYSQNGFSPEGVLDDNPETAWAFWPDTSKPYTLIVQCDQPVPVSPDTKLEMKFEFQSGHKQHILGRFRISATTGRDPAKRTPLPDEIAAIVKKTERSAGDAGKLRDYVSKNFAPPALIAARNKTKAADKALNDFKQSLPRVMVMSDKQPRKTRILDRGEYLSPREEVTVDTPGFLPPLGPDAPRNRLGFAQWLFRVDHPLTARVQVNRFWQYFFGTGLVKTAEDLGVQSEVPGHRELLDWLAVEFREKGWSQKHIVRLILTSSTYRQSSRVRPEFLARDPENRLMSRASRFRMPSLVLRDVALTASGLLNDKMFGKPVYPYQPDSVWETLAITKERDFTYPASSGPDLYRRSLYTFWRRTIGPVNMFDASARQSCKVRAGTTTTPLHALTTLNDVTWTEAARVLAEKSLKSSPDRAAQITVAFRRVLARPPVAKDLEVLTRAFERQFAHYQAAPAAAAELLKVGAAPRDNTISALEHAAMTAVCLALFNLDEALARE
jgi:hypothetical protein